MNATAKDYCDPGVTSLMTLAEWCEETGVKAEPGPNGTLDVATEGLSKRWRDQLYNLSDHSVMGGTRTIRLMPQNRTRAHGPGHGQA